jgi:hypothetical protein
MKFSFQISSLVTVLVLSGCSGHTLQDWADEEFNNKQSEPTSTKELKKEESVPSPSTNPTLDSVSPSIKGDGQMQKNLDNWIGNEWTPAVEQNTTIKEMNQDKDRPFTLQEYVDKATIYHKNKPKSDEPPLYEEINSHSVFGGDK